MKIKTLLFAIALLMLASASFGAEKTLSTASITLGSANTPYKPSSKVILIANSTATSFAAAAQHASAAANSTKGGFQYGTTSTDPAIQRKASTATAAPDAPTDATALATGFASF